MTEEEAEKKSNDKKEKEKKKKNAEGEEEEREGCSLLGPPTFAELPNGRLKCVETGHELLFKDKNFYSLTKRCRLGLIDFALSHNNPPLNMFKPHPLSRSKLICKLTGDTVNKSEEHIWKHINGKRFLNKLEQKESDNLESNGMVEENQQEKNEIDVGKKIRKNKNKDNKEKKDKQVAEIIPEVQNSSDKDCDHEEADFWAPPIGDRWDFDDGCDRWGSYEDLEQEDEQENQTDDAVEGMTNEPEELPSSRKRERVKMESSNFALSSKKKKKKSKN